MAGRVVMKISKDEEERARIMRDEKIELDWQSIMVTTERRGERKGEQKGKRKAELEIVNLLKSGKSPEDIIKQYG